MLMMSENEFLKQEKEDESWYTLENQILLNEHENMIINELSSEFLLRKSIDHPNTSNG
jgi:hypothetical protein